jgi:hypothetical protein
VWVEEEEEEEEEEQEEEEQQEEEEEQEGGRYSRLVARANALHNFFNCCDS